MRRAPTAEMTKVDEVYSVEEIAAAAECSESLVRQLADFEQICLVDDLILEADAVRLVTAARSQPGGRAPLTPLETPARKGGVPFVMSTSLHAGLAALLMLASSLDLLQARDPQTLAPTEQARLVFMMAPGPGGGGGGGGLKMPAPPPKAAIKAPIPRKVSSPVPPPRRSVPRSRPLSQQIPPAPPVRPVPRDVVTPPPVAPPQPSVQAPVTPVAADTREMSGVIDAPAAPTQTPSAGPGSGGGVGTGNGTGIGEGDGGGIGPGSGGGTGGGPYRPGSGIEPPQLVREVRPLYTDEARRRAVEGDVVLEIVVRRDGSVGDVRVVRALGSGLEQRAVAAVRQWRFSPARRQGSAVDVVVEVAVGFSLR